jgi:hypothetical protein
MASALTTSHNTGGLPDVHFVVVDGRADFQRRFNTFDAYRTSLMLGVALTARYAERTYRVAAPWGVSSTPPENRGQDALATLQPTAELSRQLGRGVVAYRVGVGALAAVWHAWAPIGSLDQAPRAAVFPSLIQLDNSLTAEWPIGTHATWGVSYRQQLMRTRSPLLLAESRHDVQLLLGWRRGVTR